ncbi:pentapeptide repeat-containing protein [uncultured Cohaesibacter sp.]|uniref:pentapeptide repeat-containing protein n=1 Tax=uncultured Cohaesibacter sp. TaxID=1002546 RepID=UPI002AA75E50|nr:pentapeptide repeat-containing protein [uncultured Cohaesibacter sp.]
MTKKKKAFIVTGGEQNTNALAFARTLMTITTKVLTFFFTRIAGWIAALFWIGIVSFVILRPDLALKADKSLFGTVEHWQTLTGGTADAGSMLRNLGWLLITAIGLPLLIWRTIVAAKQAKTGIKRTEQVARQIKIAREGQSADRYAKAAAMLSEDSLPVREAGIFALRELAIAEPEDYYFPVQDLLCSFMRDVGQQERKKAGMYRAEPDADTEAATPQQSLKLPACKSDVISALRAFSDLRTESNMKMEEKRKWRPNLEEANFNFFPGHSKPINLQRANLDQALFQRARLVQAQLQRASFRGANLEYAYLIAAQLKMANLLSAQLRGAILISAELQHADLNKAHLVEANFTDAKLQRADLRKADLRSSQLQGAILGGAKLQWADLRSSQVLMTNWDKVVDLTNARFSPPIWPEEDWPKGLQPSEIQQDAWGEYFTFIRAEPVSSDRN